MAGRGPVPGLGSSALEHHDGLLLPHTPGGLEEAPAVLDALEVEDDRSRHLVDLERFHIILDRDHRLVPRTAEGPDPDPLVFGESQKLHAEIARLGDERRRPGFREDARSAAVKRMVGVADPHCVRSEDQDIRLARLPDELLLQTAALGSRFGKTGGDQQHVFDPLVLQLGDQVDNLCRRDRDDGQIDRSRNLSDRSEDRPSGDLFALGVDQVDCPLEPARSQVAEEYVAPLAEGSRGADECDGPGIEKLCDRLRIHRRERRFEGGPFAEDDEGVHRGCLAVRCDQQRVDVRFRHVRELQADPG